MRSNARVLPWLLALAGLAILLILSRMTAWVVVAIWAAGLVLLWVAGKRLNPTPRQRMAGAAPGDIKAIGYSSQANSFVLLDHNASPLTPLT